MAAIVKSLEPQTPSPVNPDANGEPSRSVPGGDRSAERSLRIDPKHTRLEAIETVSDLEDCLSEPTSRAIEVMSRLDGDLLVLGAGGKMGPTLARMARRASQAAGVERRIIAVSRFSQPDSRQALESHGIETLNCDLLDAKQLAQLPACQNVVFMAGFKFGSAQQASATWATNTLLPALVADHFRGGRIIVFSTGNVYGFTSVAGGGSLESDQPQPIGEYAMSCLGRERLMEYFSVQNNTPMAILRLNYACELRYGVLVDLAEKVWSGQTIDLTMGHFNAIWQADASAMALAAFDVVATPPAIINISGPEKHDVRVICEAFARQFNIPCRFSGQPAADAFLTNSDRMENLLGSTRLSAMELVPAIAKWMQRGGHRLGKPTHFQSRSGRY